jgi:hypothetical protein
MRKPDPATVRVATDHSIGEWRRRRLTAAGCEPGLAAKLAADPAIDLHELLLLLDDGCPPALAARILAPLDALDRRC